MADPLTIVGTLITAGTIAASVTKQVFSLAEAFKSAPTAINTLHSELNLLTRTLKQLESTFARKLEARESFQDELIENLLESLKACNTNLWRLEAILQNKFSITNDSTRRRVLNILRVGPENLRKVRWVLDSDRVIRLREELRRLTDNLNTTLILIVYQAVEGTGRSIEDIKNNTSRIGSHTKDIRDIINKLSTHHQSDDSEAVEAVKLYAEERPQLDQIARQQNLEKQATLESPSACMAEEANIQFADEDTATGPTLSIMERLDELDSTEDSEELGAGNGLCRDGATTAPASEKVDLDATTNKPEKDGRPLVIVARKGDLRMAKLLIQFGADVNVKGDTETPLRAAVSGGHLEMVKLLLENNANVDDEGEWGETPLMAATKQNHAELARTLLEGGASPNGFNLLRTAIERQHEELLDILLTGNADSNKPGDYGFTALETAALRGSSNMVKMLLLYKADVNAPGYCGRTPLAAAIEGGSHDVFEAIWQAGADPSPDAMKQAIRQDRADILEKMLNKGADAKAWDVLRFAVSEKRLAMVKMLLEAGADPNKGGEWYLTPLKAAADKEDLDILNMLIVGGADVTDPSVREVVEIVIQRKRDDMLNALLKAGADVNSTGVLQTAIIEGRADLVMRLLEAGANVNGRDQQGRTPLTAALSAGNMSLAEDLLNRGAKP